MADQVLNVTIRGIGDFSDVVSNVNSVQKALTKLKLPDKLGDNLNKKISAFGSEYEKYQKKISEGIKTQGDYNQVEKSLNRMRTLYQEIGQDVSKISKLDMDSILNLDLGEFKQLRNEIANIEKEINKIQIGKINPKAIEDPMKALRSSLKSKKFSEKDTGLLDQLIGNVKSGKVQEAKAVLNELDNAVKKITPPKNADGSFMERVVGKLNPGNAKAATGAIEQLKQVLSSTDEEVKPLITVLDQLQKEFTEAQNSAKGEILGGANKFKETEGAVDKVTDSLKKMHEEEFSFSRQVQDIDRQIQSYFGLSQMIRKVGDIARDAFNTVKELDAAMTETAVVTNFSVGDMWNMLPTYTEQANKLGATIKDVYEAATLYYQQGLNTNQAMGLANETLKMARIAGMDAAEATDMMTSALRGFNMEINQTSAQKVNDIYSQLAAVTASDTRELGTAMEKTASLASSANMDIETTSAFLAQMIETTREAPENLGTAMKTIIARFQEMKKDPTSLVDADGVAMDVNKVDTALKSIGVALTNSKGEFRDLDDVFLDISKRWDSLSQGQQRYIATTAAGSRQQSRFIAMMSNYDRTMELVNEANNSAGASQKQFEKTMDSMSSKLNQLKNAWDEFTMGLMNNQILKTGVDGLTQFFTIVNKIIDALSTLGNKIPDPFGGITKSALTLIATLGGLNFGKKIAGGSVAAGVGWWKNEGKFRENFMKGYGVPERATPLDIYNKKIEKLGLEQQITQQVTTSSISPIVTQVPVDVTTYLQKIDTADIDPRLAAAIEEEAGNGPDIPVDARVKINKIIDANGLDENLKLPINEKPVENAGNAANQASKNFSGLGSSIANAGYALQRFGDQLGPFGGILSTIGSVMVSFGTTLGTISAQAAKAGGGFKGWASAIGPMLGIIAAAVAIAYAIKKIDEAIETDKERLERLTNAANTASDAYDSLKQEASELKGALEEIQSNEESFNGLIVGTTEFNEKLIETNRQIDELLQKYPELNNSKYLSIDKNGLKHINQEGIDFIKKQQDQLVGNASAQNILQNAYLKSEQNRQEVKQKEQEIHDIEYTRIIDEGGGYDIKKSSLTAEEQERITQLKQELKYLEDGAKNTEKIATQQALAASFTNIEASDRERMASMYVDSYESTKERFKIEADEAEMLKTYADYYGYKYDAAGKKVLDSNNEEIKIDKNALKDFYTDMVITADIQASAESLDKIENSVNQKFSKGLKLGASNGENILSGVLSGDIESDPKIVKKLAEKTPQQIEETLKELTDAEMSAFMGMKEEDFAADRENLRKEFANSIKDHAQKTFEAQSQIYEDLGAKIAKTQGLNFGQITKQYQDSTKSISEEISKLSVEQANILNNIAGQLEENVGLDTTGAFLEKATSIYGKKDKGLTKEFDDILSGIKWDSASSRLAGYTKAINSSHKEIKEFGKDMKSSASEANILGEAFDEFVGGDWTELRENADDFQNSLGKIDGAGILKASEQSTTLKNLLDSGAVSATGVAIALQGIEDGKYSVGEVDSAVLQLISSLNRLEDVSLEAHNIVSNFDPGIDTGEGEDFIKDNAKAVAEFMKNNEWGNDQLKNYIKLAAGEELWQKTLSKNKGDLKKTTKALDQYVTKFKDGFLPAYKDIISGKGINNKSLTENIDKAIKDKDISKKLGDKMKGVTAEWDENGFLQWDFNGLTTKQLEKFFQEAYGVSEEYAKLFLQDIKNYNETEGAELAKNDLKATIRSKDFQEARGAYGDNGKLILTDEDVRIFKAAGGSLKDLAEAAGISEKELKENQFKVYKKNGERRDNYADLLRDYAETFKTGDHKIGSLFGAEDLLTNGKLDLNKLIADTKSKSFDEEQSMRAAYEAYLQGEKQGDRTLYEGMEIEHGLQTYEDFATALEGMTESSQWVQVGETIGTQIVNALNASSFLESMRGGDEGAAITEGRDGPKLNKENLDTVISQIQTSGESTKEAQKDITTYLGQSKELFDSLKSNPEKQKEILDSVANKLKKLEGFDPQKINKVFRDSFGQGYDLYGIQKKISNLGVSGQKAYDYYSKNGLGNTDLYNRPRIEWGEDPSKNKNYKNAHSWGENRESLKNRTSTYLSQAAGFGYGKDGKEVQIAFTPIMKGKNGEAKILSKETVDSYLKDIVGQATNEKGSLDISKLMELDKKGLIMGAFKGEGAAETSGALGELEHYLEEAREKGLNLQEVLDGIKFSPKLKGQELENYIKKIDGLTDGQKKILLNTEITDKDKATQFIDTIEKEFGGKDKKKKEIILQATQKIADGDKEGGQKLLKDNGFSEDDVKKITQQVEILYSGKIVNKDQFKKSIDEQIDDLLKSGSSKSAKKDVKVTGKATIKQDKPKDTKAGVKYEKKGQDNPDDKEAGVKYKLKKQDLPKPKTADLTYNLVSQDSPKPQKVNISPNFTGTWEKTLKIRESKAQGSNNKIPYSPLPSFGSAARGRYGMIGPKDKGGLTLTGEKGFEIAWLPSENRSMILGADGPQMINLPNDAVVYTHEQSKDIIKRKGIPAGSHSGRTDRDNTTTTSSKPSKTSSGKTGGNTTKKKSTDDKKEKANTSAISKIIVWWDNITRRADATQRKADKNQKTYEKYLKDIKATLKDTGTIGGGNAFISNTNKAISLYNDQLKRATTELTNLDIGTGAQRKAKGKKATKKANKQAFMNEQGGAVRISYTKGGKKKKTVNKTIATAGYIKEQDGTYIIDQAKLNKIKNKEERKALADALNKEINDRISKKNAAEDNIEKANEALEKFSEELYNTFFAWENELTKIWNITQKIEQAQSRMSRNDAYDELLKAQLSTGKLTAGAESRNKDLTNFRSRLETQNNLLKERQDAITESQKEVQRILTSEDEKQTLANVNNKLNANAKATQKLNALNNAKQAKQAYDNAITNRKTTQSKIDKIQAKIIKLKGKKNLSKADKQEIEKLRKQRDSLKKQKESYDKIIKDNKVLASKVNQLQQEYNNVSSNALNETQKRGYEQYQKALTDQITAQEWGRKFANPQMRADGTIDIQFNTEAFETARTNGEFTSDMAKAIQDWVKKLQEASSNLQQNYEELTREVTDYYTQLESLQQEWADYGKELTEITETYEKEKIDKIKQLSDEIKKTLDQLLNDVKRNLDERRRQQENTKTEQDISQKQQRLAALRADTSGGHQVEIAQLEKEIAEAQQNYQNSLEDQLLDKLQQQADLAAEQRERQIELQEMLVSSVSNIEKVNEWMIRAQGYSNLKEDEQNAFKEEVRAEYRSKNNYDQLTKAEQDEVDTNFEEFFHGLVTNSEKQEKLNLAIGGLEGTLKALDSYLEKQNQLVASSSGTGGSTSGGSSTGGSTSGGNTGGGNKTTTAAAKEEARVAALRNYDKKLNDYASNGKLSGSELKKLIEAGNNSYVNKNGAAVFADLHRVGFSWDKILTAAKAAKYSKKDIKTWGSSDAFKKALKSYATGGLAGFTGPAWLDGTPSKPELVLNSTDTRNFIALRDVLGKVMSSNGSTENSYANTEFNININVEKVADDYDVDKIITKVKKEIIKSAGYRNVTQVRSFRY